MKRHKGTVIYPIKKSYNLTQDQQQKLWHLSEALDMGEAEMVRLGLKLIYERTFPDGEQCCNEGTGQYNRSYRIRLSDKQKSQLKSIAIKHNKSEAAMLRELIKEAFERS